MTAAAQKQCSTMSQARQKPSELHCTHRTIGVWLFRGRTGSPIWSAELEEVQPWRVKALWCVVRRVCTAYGGATWRVPRLNGGFVQEGIEDGSIFSIFSSRRESQSRPHHNREATTV